MPIMFEKLTCKFRNISLSNENVETVISLAFFPRKPDRNLVTN